MTRASVAVESRHRPLFEDISDAEDEPPTEAATPPRPPDISQHVSPVALFQSPVGSAYDDGVKSWPCDNVADDCSAAATASAACQLFPTVNAAATSPAVPDVDFYRSLTSPLPPPLEDMMSSGVMLASVMTPLTIDTGVETRYQEVTNADDACQSAAEVMDAAQQQSDDVMDTSQFTSCVTSDVNGSPPMISDVMEQPPPTTSVSFDDTVSASVSPTPPKIPRLRIVMGAGDTGQLTTSPGSTASLPYVVTVDDTQADVTEQSDSAASPRCDVTDDVTESPSPLVESVSRRKVKHSTAAKVRSVRSVHVPIIFVSVYRF